MYYTVVIINSKAVQMFLLCLNNFPPKVTVFKRFKCKNKKKRFSPPGDILNFYVSSWSISLLNNTVLKLACKQKAICTFHQFHEERPAPIQQDLQRASSSDTSQLPYSAGLRLRMNLYEQSLIIVYLPKFGHKESLAVQRSPIFCV